VNADLVMRRLVALALPLTLAACDGDEWITDMKEQPSVGTWQQFPSDSLLGETTPFRGMPQGSVPVTGVTVAQWQVNYDPTIANLNAMAALQNPVPADERSLENGRRQFQINCSVCHGTAGDVNTPLRQVAVVMGAVVPPLASGNALTLADGYIWGIIRNGRGLMPNVNRIPERDRWDVVNYIRGLQGRYPVETGPVGFPGQTGTALPGHSSIGPTVPSVHARPSTAGITPRSTGEPNSGGHE
jgi:mono/diheme cytochrome c family protein